ncbi:3,4-dihydroxy-2-butanone 4-phosphate synthase [Aureobasidium pullulans]|uniref:3,4-dihydroxy-2-butanone 4-phosphate synthase n=1 Tax=Aureobasidium pullulans TaxID=5580 RepID=A0A4S9ENP2_AURPU|nr:3,4-dihydroxy-2-butanone 4-phosphate synthase [Aureobasidium pullulans]THZ65313.1 3,4-dihydroxy-2-butanone 4-phosphate synthase [Aureobasidium pullulans]
MADHSSDLVFDDIPSAIKAFGTPPPPSPPLYLTNTLSPLPAAGEFVLVLDSPHRENEGDLIIAASALTPAKASFMIHHTSGYLCAALPNALADKLDLPPMVAASENSDPNRTAYTITIDAAENVTTGISATDRSTTCKLLAGKDVKAGDFRRPGHVVPLRAVAGGVRQRQGHTEAAVEFARLSGDVNNVGVIAEIVEESTEVEGKAERGGLHMMRAKECIEFGRRYGIKVVTIEHLKKYVEDTEGKL